MRPDSVLEGVDRQSRRKLLTLKESGSDAANDGITTDRALSLEDSTGPSVSSVRLGLFKLI